MKRLIARCACFVFAFLAFAPVPERSPAKRVGSKEQRRFVSPPEPAVLPSDLQAAVSAVAPSATAADTFELASFDFETGGLPDPQGWVSVDRTAQLDEFFHVAGSTELDGGMSGRLVALEGSQSMWCGVAPSLVAPFCAWGTLPGYGNNWAQLFSSKTFTCDSIRVSYMVAWDTEPVYDKVQVEYSDDATSNWVALPVKGGIGYYDEFGSMVESFTVPASLASIRIRFRFESDGAWSDEDGLWFTDGALLVDSITVDCYSGGAITATYFEDFEGEVPGSRVTDDGVWMTTPAPSFGSFADLYPGVGLLQEDPCVTVLSQVWGWFDDPTTANYECHQPDPRPDVGAVPFGNTDGLYLSNAIWSPRIFYAGTGTKLLFIDKVYRDQPFDNLVFYNLDMRSWVTNCPEPWQRIEHTIWGEQRNWVTEEWSVGHLVEPGAAELQFQIQVLDLCAIWCNLFGSGQCHSHAPLFGSVRVLRIDDNGPQFFVRHIDLFQDNFADDGTLAGSARADAANDIAPPSNPAIVPGDSLTVAVSDPEFGLGTDAFTGVGPAVYLYIAVWPPDQPGKLGANIEAPETRTIGKRYPLVDSLVHDGVTWYSYRMDSVLTGSGSVVGDIYCVDLNDAVFTPGDTICYVLGAANTRNEINYFSRRLNGQGDDFVTGDLSEALSSPMEFTILPAGGYLRGGDILYVDDTDDRGGPAELFFDTAFATFAALGSIGGIQLVDRYDVLGPSSAAGNSLASRVSDVQAQIIVPYRKIIWSSGNLSNGLIGDGGSPNGGSSVEKSDDFALLFQFLDTHPDMPGIYISGDDVASDWVALSGAGAVSMRSAYMNFGLDPAAPDGNHLTAVEPVAPTLDAVGAVGSLTGDQLIAFGGCPVINDFDLLQTTGLSVDEFENTVTGKTYVVSQITPNSVGDTARVVLSGFSYHYVRDAAAPAPEREYHLLHILQFLQNTPPTNPGSPLQLANRLEANYPNPFNPTTTIEYEIKDPGHVALRIYNVAGQLIRTLVNEVQTPAVGGFKVTWDGRNNAGQTVSSGVYFYKMAAPGFSRTRKMVLLR